ncbi:MAG: hypothetical protein M1272_00210 [Firmicutes bacterium]|nr:hypothetical protein [Bacillota bacterium]
MQRTLRRALWGYRIPDANRYIEALESRMVLRQAERDRQLNELKVALAQSEDAMASAERVLQSLQRDYFRLSGELSALSSRSEESVGEAQEDIAARETTLWAGVESKRAHNQVLREMLQTVPMKVRAVIEEIAETLSHGADLQSSPLHPPAPRESDSNRSAREIL